MTDENKIEGVNTKGVNTEGVNTGGNAEVKRECFCQSKWFKKFLTKTLAVFVGVYAALSLFAAMHKPPMPPCPYAYRSMMRPPMHCHYHHFKKHDFKKGDFHKRMEKRDFQRFEKRDADTQPSVKS